MVNDPDKPPLQSDLRGMPVDELIDALGDPEIREQAGTIHSRYTFIYAFFLRVALRFSDFLYNNGRTLRLIPLMLSLV